MSSTVLSVVCCQVYVEVDSVYLFRLDQIFGAYRHGSRFSVDPASAVRLHQTSFHLRIGSLVNRLSDGASSRVRWSKA